MIPFYNNPQNRLLQRYQQSHEQLISSLTKIQYEITSYYSKLQTIQWPRTFINMKIYSKQQSQKLFSIISTFSNQIKQTQFIYNRFFQTTLQKYKQCLHQNLKSLETQTVHIFTIFIQCKQKRISSRDDKKLQLTQIYLDALIKMIKQLKQVIDKILKLQNSFQSNNNRNFINNHHVHQLQQKLKSTQLKCQNLQKVNLLLSKNYVQIEQKYQRKLNNIENELNRTKYNENNLIYQNQQLRKQNEQLKEHMRQMEERFMESKRMIQIEPEDLQKNDILIRIKRKQIKKE